MYAFNWFSIDNQSSGDEQNKIEPNKHQKRLLKVDKKLLNNLNSSDDVIIYLISMLNKFKANNSHRLLNFIRVIGALIFNQMNNSIIQQFFLTRSIKYSLDCKLKSNLNQIKMFFVKFHWKKFKKTLFS